MENGGEFLANKMRELNPNNVPSSVEISWYTRESYPRCLAIFEDAADRPPTFDAWLIKAEQIEQDLRQRGMRVLRMEIDPDALAAWCAAHACHVDKKGLAGYAHFRTSERLRSEAASQQPTA